jgi:hypothetical protein
MAKKVGVVPSLARILHVLARNSGFPSNARDDIRYGIRDGPLAPTDSAILRFRPRGIVGLLRSALAAG